MYADVVFVKFCMLYKLYSSFQGQEFTNILDYTFFQL